MDFSRRLVVYNFRGRLVVNNFRLVFLNYFARESFLKKTVILFLYIFIYILEWTRALNAREVSWIRAKGFWASWLRKTFCQLVVLSCHWSCLLLSPLVLSPLAWSPWGSRLSWGSPGALLGLFGAPLPPGGRRPGGFQAAVPGGHNNNEQHRKTHVFFRVP